MPGAFRVLGGDIIPTPVGDIQTRITVVPDPKQIEYELMQVAGNLANLASPLTASAGILAADTQERFDTETDPDGNAWIPLDEEYLANKQSLGYPDDILHRTGDLEKAATSVAAYRIVGDSVFFDPRDLPDYGLIHQTGAGNPADIGAASLHRFRARDDEDYKKREGGAHSSIGIGRGNALAARPFLGMSEEAEGKIWGVFDFWFEQSLEPATTPYVHSGGTIQQRISGRFGPKVIF